MDNISFKSRIRIVSTSAFNETMKGCKNNVIYPWTLKQTVFAPKALTEDVFDCTAFGINDGENVLFYHLCPNSPQNFNWANLKKSITKDILSKFELKNIKGLILGSKRDNISSPRSTGLFELIEGVFKNLSIPYSKFKGGNFENHLAYDSVKDEWIIGNNLLDIVSDKKVLGSPETIIKRIFDDVKIADIDELTW